MWENVEVSNGELKSPSQVDFDLLKFHRVGGCTGWYTVLNALAEIDHQTTAPVLSCAGAISVFTHTVKARDLWGGILLTELRFLDQRHINSVAFKDDCKLV